MILKKVEITWKCLYQLHPISKGVDSSKNVEQNCIKKSQCVIVKVSEQCLKLFQHSVMRIKLSCL